MVLWFGSFGTRQESKTLLGLPPAVQTTSGSKGFAVHNGRNLSWIGSSSPVSGLSVNIASAMSTVPSALDYPFIRANLHPFPTIWRSVGVVRNFWVRHFRASAKQPPIDLWISLGPTTNALPSESIEAGALCG